MTSLLPLLRHPARTAKAAKRAPLTIGIALLCALLPGLNPAARAQTAPTLSPVQGQRVEITTAPLAGTVISNRAYVTFESEGQPVRLDSDTVSIAVLGVPALTLTPSIERKVAPGAPVALAHRLTNTGNIATAYTLQIASLSGDSYDLENPRVALDANGNGVFDNGETLLGANTPVNLNPGQFADLVLIGQVPASAAPDSVSRTRLTATVSGAAPGASGATGADFPALAASVLDTLSNTAGASVLVSKSATVAQSAPGGEITYTVTARNTGTVSPLPQNISVDGALRSLILLRDAIPANTTLLAVGDAPIGATRLFHRAGDAPDSFVSAQPDLTRVDAVALGLSRLEAQSAISLSFRVRVGQNASAAINNTARFLSLDPATGAVTSVSSNEVVVTLPRILPTLTYYTTDNYLQPAGATSIGRPLFLQGSAPASNRDAGLIETVQITIKSELTGDTVVVTAIETGPNTGIFRVQTPIATSGGAVDTSDATLSIRANDVLDAMIEDSGGARAIAGILVDPFGVVFDSRTNAPIAGARVTLIDITGAGNGGNAGGPARVFDFDGTTPFPATLTTGADGTFQFPAVAGSTYRLEIVPPTGYSFPSKISVFLLPAARRIDPSGSYGNPFRVDATTGAIRLDVPLDAPPPGGLFLQKIASRSTAEIADFVDYQILVRNTTGTPLTALAIRDTLPRGFSLVGNSVRLNGVATPNPTGAPGPALTFNIGAFAPDAQIRLTYRVRIGAGVASGDNRNRAFATATTLAGPVTSNTAAANVQVNAGVLTERAIIFGKVFLDLNKNRVQDEIKGAKNANAKGATTKITATTGTNKSAIATDGKATSTDDKATSTDDKAPSTDGKAPSTDGKSPSTDGGEIGVPGVRVWIEDGTYAITDSDGKYSLYGLSARTHVVKIDRETLPRGAITEPLTVRHGGRGDSAFADLQKGELHKVNFALIDADAALIALIEKRRAAGDPFGAEIASTLQTDLRRTIDDVRPDSRSLPSSGIVSAAGAIANGSSAGFDTLNPGVNNFLNTSPNGNNAGTFSAGGNVVVPSIAPGNNAGFPFSDFDRSPGSLLPPTSTLETPNGATPNSSTPSGTVPLTNSDAKPTDKTAQSKDGKVAEAPKTAIGQGDLAQFEAFLKGQTNQLAILSPANGAITASQQVNIRLKGLSGADFVLRVNGAVISTSRIGARLSDAARSLQALEYVGVQLKAGQNSIEAAQIDAFGNEHDKVKIQVSAPGRAGKLVIEAPKSASADGASGVPITLRLVDAKGLPVTSRAPVTLETASGRVDLLDLNEREPGVQIFIEGGVTRFNLIAPAEPGDGLIRALSGDLESRQKISFLPALRPLIALGTLEGGVNYFSVKPQGVSGDLFQDDLKGLYNRDLGNTAVSGRAALFLKGRVSGKDLLTLRYDSQLQQGGRERLFRDIQPDEYYPVYGDGALKGFDAQSSSRLYVRLDRDRNSFLFGDFTTATTTQFNTLGNYQRSLNGARTHLENEKYKLDLFGARDNGRQIVDEIRANGTSGGYLLRVGGLIENSERVEILVRDRNNLGSILEVRPQTRFSDYEFDFATGRLLFRSPVPSYDANLNPLSVRVFYEVESGGPKFWVQGLNGAVKITPNLEIGGSAIRDADPQDNFDLKTLSATFKAGEKTTVSAELASSSRDSIGNGDGKRLEILHDSAKLQARFFAGRTSANFDNPGSVLSRGRGEISLRAAWRLNAKTRILSEAIRTSDTQLNGTNRTGYQASLEREIGRGLRAELGLRHAQENASTVLNGTNADVNFTSLRARLTAPVGSNSSVFGEVESDISDTSRRVLALGGDTKLNARSRLYARHEFISSLDGRYALNDSQEQQKTVFGIDSAYSQSGHLFSEYRLGGALSGREGQAAIGVRDAWTVTDGVKILGGFERTKSMNSGLGTGTGGTVINNTGNDSTALTGGLEYTRSENLKATTRLELRSAGVGNSVLGTLGAAARLNDEFTLLSRGIFNLQRQQDNQNDAAQHRFQLGLSYRDKRDDKWSGLAKYEFRQTRNGTSAGARLPGEVGFTGDNNGTVHLFSLDANRQSGANLTLSGHLAAKFNSDSSNGFSSSTSAALASGRAIYNLNRKTEVSAQAGVLTSRGGGIQSGVGAELGRLVGRDLWLSGGYNSGAFRDGDLNGSSYSRRGPYLRIRFKFDEGLFGSREAKLLAQDKNEKTGALREVDGGDAQNLATNAALKGAHTVEVPVISVDAQTQARTTLPMTAEIEVADGTKAPQSVEVDTSANNTPATTANDTAITPLNPRIVEASGALWNFNLVINTQDDSEMMTNLYAETSRARRAGIVARRPVMAYVPVAPSAKKPRVELRPRADERVGFTPRAGGSK